MNNLIHPDLFPYQREGAQWLTVQRRGAGPLEQNAMLADDMGLGKTPEAIAGCDLVRARNILVICPGIARDNWMREFEHWQMIPRSISMIKSGTDKPQTEVVITSYAMLMSRPVLVALLARQWDVLIMDEAHTAKNPAALTTMILYGAACDGQKGLAPRCSRIWLLTGTPMPNGPHEMWTHASALFPPAVKNLESYTGWCNRFCYSQWDDDNQRTLAATNVPEFIERLFPYIKRRLTAHVLPDLPPLRFGNSVVAPETVPAMPEDAIEASIVLRSAIASLKKDPTPEEMQAILHAQAMHISSLLKWTGVTKAPAVAEAIRTDMANGLKKLVVFARHKEVFKILEAGIPGAQSITGDTPDKKRQMLIDLFQSDIAGHKLPVILCNIDVASVALTLTAANDCAFAETSWVPKDIEQAAKRCHRIGQTKPVLAKVYSLAGSLDEVVSRVIVRKFNMLRNINSQFTG